MPGADDPCPLCGKPLYGWVTLPAEGAAPVIGRAAPGAGTRVIDRCEACGVGVERGREIDLAEELRAISEPRGEGGALRIGCANRASLQAALSAEGWAPVDRLPGRLALTPRSLALLGERNGYRLERPSFPPMSRGQGWMWQTLVNALTFHNNFARDVRAGKLRRSTTRRWMFAIDAVVTVLAAPLALLASFPLETISALLNRGGWMEATTVPARVPAGPAGAES